MSAVPYQALEIEYEEEKERSIFGDEFRWLDVCLLYTPMWCRYTPDLRKRNTSISYLILISLVIVTAAYFVHWVWFDILDIGNLFHATMVWIFYILEVLLRFLHLYYFWNIFAFPWNFSIKGFGSISSSSHAATIKYYKYTAMIMLFVQILLDMIYTTWFAIAWNDILSFIPLIFMFIPDRVFMIVYFVICVKYGIYLKELADDIRDETCDLEMKEIHKKYKLLYQSAMSDYGLYNKYLRWSIEIYLCTRVLWAWLATYDYLQNQAWQEFLAIIICIIQGLCYAIGAWFVNEMYIELQGEVWNCEERYSENNSDRMYVYYLLQFMNQHPLIVQMGNLVITKKSCVKFAIVFIVAKFLSYSIKPFYQ